MNPSGEWNLIMMIALFCSACECGNVYEKVGNSEYFIGKRNITEENNTISWFNARRNCQKEGGQLVSVQTEKQMVELLDYILRKGYPNGSIFSTSGLSFNSGNPYRWDAIEQPLDFTKWLPYDGPLPNSFLSLQLVESELYMVRSWGFDPFYICEYVSPQRLFWVALKQCLTYQLLACVLFIFLTFAILKIKLQQKRNLNGQLYKNFI